MREIKFRAKHGKEWVYGDLRLTSREPHIWADPYTSHIINIETLGQYTGLKDKNGKEIYEGDIVRVCILSPNYIGKNPEPYYVDTVCVYSQGGFCYKRISPFDKKKLSRNWTYKAIHSFHILTEEVIGNIHDNKELLKEE